MNSYQLRATPEETEKNTTLCAHTTHGKLGVVKLDGAGGSASAPHAEPNQPSPVSAHPFGGGPAKERGAGVDNTKNTLGM